MSLSRTLQYLFLAIIVTTVGFSLYQWNASRASTQKTAPNNGLVGYWSFDEGTGTQAGDASGNGNTGTLTNGPTWVAGKLGKAINLDGTNDYVSVPQNGKFNISTTAFTVSGWVRDDTPSASLTVNYHRIISWYDGTNNVQLGIGRTTSPFDTRQYYLCNGSTSSAVTTGISAGAPLGWNYVVATYNGTTYTLYVNGVASSGGTLDAGVTLFSGNSTTLYIGQRGDNARYVSGQIDEVRVYNRALSSTEITNLYNLGAEKLNISPTTSLTSGLVGYWTFDGKDTPWSSPSAGTATDKSGNGNTGTLTNMSQSTSPAIGQIGQSLNFDGTDDYTTTTDSATLDVLDTDNLTLSGWFYRDTATTDDTIIAKRNGIANTDDGYILYIDDTTDKLTFEVSENSGTDEYQLESTTTFTTPGWYHYAVVWDQNSATNSEIYISGVTNGATDTGTIGNLGDLSNALTFNIGSESDGGNPFDGRLDETRVYNRALSATEIQSLYDLGASDKVNSSVSQNQGTGRLDSGLVGYWKLDDGSGTTATDSSPNASNGTLTNGPTWGTGQIGGDVVFDGADDHITMGDQDVLDMTGAFTVSAWVYPNSFGGNSRGRIVDKDSGLTNGYSFFVDNANLSNGIEICVNTAAYPSSTCRAVANAVTLSTWQHFVASFDGTNVTLYKNGSSLGTQTLDKPNATTSNFVIGGRTTDNARNFNGNIDEVRVYKRALSADEVSQLYRLTAPTGVDTSLKGYWSFDGSVTNWTSSSAGTTSDLSGSGNTGTLTNMSQSTTPVRGKIGQALSFDGVNQHVSMSGVSVTSFPFTTIAWFKTTNATASYRTISSLYGSANSAIAIIQFDLPSACASSSRVKYIVRDNVAGASATICSLNNLNDETWHQAVGVSASASDHKFYVDGVLQGSSVTALGTTTFNSVQVGSYNGIQHFPGSIDEVRVYNRALSSTEVSALYNAGR